MVITASSGGYGYSDAAATSSSNIQSLHLQGFDNSTEIFNLSTSMEMIDFQNKNLQQPQQTDQSLLFNKLGSCHSYGGPGPGPGPSSYHHDYTKPDDAESTPWLVDQEDQSLRCVFSCEGNEKTSQGLSLSLSSSNNPSTIGFLQHDDDMRFVASSSRINGFFPKPLNIQNHQQVMQDGLLFLGKAGNNNIHYQEQYFLIRNSKYLGAVQELLNEFCDLGTKENDYDHHHHHSSKMKKLQKTNQWLDQENVGNQKQSLYSLDLLELQKRKTKLFQLLQEVDRRYKHYCDQMKTVTSSFEAIAGNGAAKVYSTLASKAMSRHFRCLRDAIVEQIKVSKKAMGEKDSSIAPGTTKGETPRLRVLDQTLRQQRAFQQMGLMETHPWRPQRGLPERSVSVLRAWLFEHFLHPYPSDVDKHILARQTGLSRSQVSNWFINARVRLWKPMVEEMYLEELKDQENAAAAAIDDDNDDDDDDDNLQLRNEDQKPTHNQLVRIDSECLSSIVNNQEKIDDGKGHNVFATRAAIDSLTGMEMDFSSYNYNPGNGVHFRNENPHRGYGGGGGGGVSLTLGLQQHGGNGVSLAFSSASQSSLFYPRDHIEDCQQVEYSLLDNEGQNLPYRNLMGAQLLHDLTR